MDSPADAHAADHEPTSYGGREGAAEEPEHRYSIQDFTLAHEIAFNAVICMGQLMTQAGLAMTIVPVFIIGEHFGVSNPGQLSWLAAVRE